jgi:sterol desaturase/sphingolipid hydroxylase (fatty acid hydroxylase superfamily)
MKENPLTFEEVLQMDLPPIIIYVAPLFFVFVLIEWVIGIRRQQKLYDPKDFAAATTIGLVNVAVNTLTKAFTFGIILFFYNLVPWSIPPTWWSFIACFFILDLCRYWAHKVGHEHRFWWSTHVTHHSSQQYNFSVSFRLSWIQQIKIIFFIPVALMGFHPFVFFVCHQIAVVYQFWIHTELIKKMPRWVEFFFVTPSHHRVHHATNPQYIDKNYGSTFIIWDRIFGTFEPEIEKPIYGITTPVNSYNPVYLVFHEVIDICKDLRKVRSPKQFFQVLSSGPGVDVLGEVEKPLAEEQKEVAVSQAKMESANPSAERQGPIEANIGRGLKYSKKVS